MKRSQAPKPYVPRANVKRIQELRRSNAASAIPSGKVYKRRGKYAADYS
jgi:hypothetical protein